MKAKSSFAVMLLAVLLVFASCETGSDHATLRVNLRKDSRSIVPADYPLEIESYRISGTGPGGESAAEKKKLPSGPFAAWCALR